MPSTKRVLGFALALVTVVGTVACKKSAPPVADGYEFTYRTEIRGKGGVDSTFSFAKAGDGWMVTQTTQKDGDEEAKEQTIALDANLMSKERGKPLSIMAWPFFLPKDAREPGGRSGDATIKDSASFGDWPQAWHGQSGGVAEYWYHPKTGFLLGIKAPAMEGLSITLKESNVPGLMP